VINVKGFMENLQCHTFYPESIEFKLIIQDALLPSNNQEWILHFEGGRMEVKKRGRYQTEITLDVSDFSSLLLGVVSFKELYRLGKVRLSEAKYVNLLNQLFLTLEKPRCISAF